MHHQDDITKIRLEVNEHRHRIRTVEQVVDNQNQILTRVAEGLDKLERRFTIFIVVLVMSGVFSEPLSKLVMGLLF